MILSFDWHWLRSPSQEIFVIRNWLSICCVHFCRIRLVAVATQKFVADVASDALQHCKARQAAVVKDKRDKQQKDKRLILTMDDLSKALREYGVNVKHQEYFADSPSTGVDSTSREE